MSSGRGQGVLYALAAVRDSRVRKHAGRGGGGVLVCGSTHDINCSAIIFQTMMGVGSLEFNLSLSHGTWTATTRLYLVARPSLDVGRGPRAERHWLRRFPQILSTTLEFTLKRCVYGERKGKVSPSYLSLGVVFLSSWPSIHLFSAGGLCNCIACGSDTSNSQARTKTPRHAMLFSCHLFVRLSARFDAVCTTRKRNT